MARTSGLLTVSLVALAFTVAEGAMLADFAHAQDAPSASGQMEQYERRIRNAMTPEEVALACRSPRGSIIVNNEIIVCAERDSDQRLRVPSTREAEPVNPDEDRPVAVARRVMDADLEAPVGANADTFRPGRVAEQGVDLLALPTTLSKTTKALEELATEEDDE